MVNPLELDIGHLLNVCNKDLWKMTEACKHHQCGINHRNNIGVNAAENKNVMQLLMKVSYTNIIFRFPDSVYEKRVTLLSKLNIGLYGVGTRHHGNDAMKQMKNIFYKLILNKMKTSITTMNPGINSSIFL